MGKKQHQKDKLWLTTTEWKTIYGGKKANIKGAKCLKMPFNYCSLKYVIALNPCCTKEGIVFDYENILEFIKKHKINPLTNKKLKVKDLIKIKFHENLVGEIHCPITYKPFNDNTKIVVVPKSGNVYSFEGLSLSNLKGDEWRDPLSEEHFNKIDLIVIQDPENPNKFNMNAFYKSDSQEKVVGTTVNNITNFGHELLKATQEHNKTINKEKVVEEMKPILKDKINEATYSTGKVAASFTSTSAPVAFNNETAILADDKVRYGRVKEKGYVSLITNFGKINFELFCDIAPKTCENFIKLCKSKYYDGTKFHRLIRHFVLQGGDPTGTGKGGESFWGEPFPDEISAKWSHDNRGILSMANSGPNTNKSQFFIVLRPAMHLDKKHTIFGKIVGGLKVLDEIELVESDNQDRPIESIEIISTDVFVDPFEKVDEDIKMERSKLNDEKVDESLQPKNKREEKESRLNKLKGTLMEYQANSKSVGKYLCKLMPPPSDINDNSSITSKAHKRQIIGEPLEDIDEISEYESKKLKRQRENDFGGKLFNKN